jgi:hypothetical protein
MPHGPSSRQDQDGRGDPDLDREDSADPPGEPGVRDVGDVDGHERQRKRHETEQRGPVDRVLGVEDPQQARRIHKQRCEARHEEDHGESDRVASHVTVIPGILGTTTQRALRG